MNDLTKKAQEAVGKAKEKVGEFTGNRGTKGKAKGKGRAKAKGQQTESKFKHLADDAKDVAENMADRVKGVFKK